MLPDSKLMLPYPKQCLIDSKHIFGDFSLPLPDPKLLCHTPRTDFYQRLLQIAGTVRQAGMLTHTADNTDKAWNSTNT